MLYEKVTKSQRSSPDILLLMGHVNDTHASVPWVIVGYQHIICVCGITWLLCVGMTLSLFHS